LVHELRQLRRAENSPYRRRAGFALIKSCGMTLSISTELMRSLIARSMPASRCDMILHQLAHERNAPIGEIVDIVDLAFAVRSRAARARPRANPRDADAHRVGRVEAEGASSS